MNETAMPSEPKPNVASKKRSKANFPRLPLEKVLPLVQAVWDQGQGDPVRATLAFEKLNRTSTSGPGRTLIAAANSGYGLINGNSSSPTLALTELGRRIVTSDKGEPRQSAIAEAVLKNEITDKVKTNYLNRPLPADQVVSDYIKSLADFDDDESKLFWGIIFDNLKFAGMIITEGNKNVIVEPSFEASDTSSPTAAPASEREVLHVSPSEGKAISTLRPAHQSEFHFNIQIHLPSDASPEVYDAIFSSISKNLLRSDD